MSGKFSNLAQEKVNTASLYDLLILAKRLQYYSVEFNINVDKTEISVNLKFRIKDLGRFM